MSPALLPLISLLSAPASAKDGEVNYKDGFLIEDRGGRYTLQINGALQARLEHTALRGPDDPQALTTLYLARARLKLSGRAHSESFKYSFLYGWDEGVPELKSAWIEPRFEVGERELRLRVGQFKIPGSQEWNTGSTELPFAERSIAHDAAGPWRDVGLVLHDDLGDDGLRWAAGAFRGAGTQTVVTAAAPETGEAELEGARAPIQPLFAARLAWGSDGLDRDRFFDLDGGGPRVGAGAYGLLDLGWTGEDRGADVDARSVAGLDALLKLHGASAAGWIAVEGSPAGGGWGTMTPRDLATSAELAWTIAARAAPAVRWARVLELDDDGDTERELAGGLTVFFADELFEWHAEAGWVTEGPVQGHPVGELAARSQLQFAF